MSFLLNLYINNYIKFVLYLFKYKRWNTFGYSDDPCVKLLIVWSTSVQMLGDVLDGSL